MSSIIDKKQKFYERFYGEGAVPPLETSIQSARRPVREAEEQAAWLADMDEKARERAYEFKSLYQPTLDEKTAAYSRTMLDELQLAKRQAAGKLGFALSSGPGTSGMSTAAQLGLDRQFATQRAMGLGRLRGAAADFRLNWDLNEDRFDYGFEMANLRFKHEQILLRQRAELNSDSWWDTLGSIIGIGAAAAIAFGTSGTASPVVFA